MKCAIGISVHTGWGACVVVAGSLSEPRVSANQVVHVLDDSKRFCYHMAAEMDLAAAKQWLAQVRREALGNARRALAPLLSPQVTIAAIVAKDHVAAALEHILSAHPRIHTAEGCFYRDVFRDACTVPVQIISPGSLDPSRVGKLAKSPWGKDQRMAALAAFQVLQVQTRARS